jgi:hypothetical protein
VAKKKNLIKKFNSYYYGGMPTIVPVGAPTNNHLVIGDSISTNPYAYTTDPADGYIGQFISAKGITSLNKAFSGYGIYYGCSQMYQFATTPHTESMSLMMGLNDARSSALGEDLNIVIGGASDIFALHYSSTYYNINTSASKTGTWIPVGGASPVRRTGSVVASQTIGDTFSISFNGDACALKTLLHDVASRGFTIHVDGNLVYTYSPLLCNSISCEPNGGSQYYSPYTIVLSGFGAGAHTLLVTITAGTGSYFAWFDYLVELYPHSSVGSTQPCVWLEVPHLRTPDGYAANSPNYSKSNDGKIDALNAAVWSSQQFQYFRGYSNFGRIQTNYYYEPNDTNQSHSDGVHPKEQGATNIATPFIQTMS